MSPPERSASLPDSLPRQRDKWTGADYRRLLRVAGLKVTQQRLHIFAALANGPKHVTAQEVFEAVAHHRPEIGFATVYRFLRHLTQAGYVSEIRMGAMPARYEMTPRRHHDHLTCTECGRIVEFENEKIEKLQEQVAEENGFTLTGHVLELYGICRSCQTRNPPSSPVGRD